jgi:putative hemolysin
MMIEVESEYPGTVFSPEASEDFRFSYARPEQKPFDRALIRIVEAVTGQARLERLYRDWAASGDRSKSFFEAALELLRVRPRFDGHPLAEIPTDRPVLFLANHPFGVIDGLTLGCLATKVRPDLKIMTHSMLCQVPEARPYLLPVDFDRSAAARLTTVRTRQRAIEWLTDGHAVGIFPGGGIATAGRPLRGPALEHPWHVFVARLLAVPDLLVVPVFFHGQNSRLFQVASHLNYPLRVALIFHETRRRMGRDLRVTIGTPFRADSLPRSDRAGALDDLRRRTLALGNARPEVLSNTFRFRDWIEVD